MTERNIQQVKIAIYGAGAMGTVLGALLTKGGLRVDLITRNHAHVDALKTKGATIQCIAENKVLVVPVKALLPEEMTEEYDVIFLMTKQRHNEEIVKGLLPFLSKDGVICSTQNGLPEEKIASVIGKERTYGAVTSFGANFLEAGGVALTSKLSAMKTYVGGFENGNEKQDLLLEILSRAGKAIKNENFAMKTDNLLGVRWAKLAINSAFSGLSVVTGCTFGQLAKRCKSRKIALGILRESIAVAKELGISIEKMQGQDMEYFLGGNTPIKKLIAYLVLPFAMKSHKELRSGMLFDVEAGRKCEIDYIDGVICKKGAETGIKTPFCEKVVELVHGIENGLYETAYNNLDFFEQ